MKTIHKVKVTIKKGEIESSSYEVIDISDNGVSDGKEIEILYETLADYVKRQSETRGHGNFIE